MKTIPFSTKQINSLNVLTVSAGTNTPCGGDTGHGGRTFFSLKNDASTDMRVGLNGGRPTETQSVEIYFGGDSEYETFIEALEFALFVLKTQNSANSFHAGFIQCE